MGLYGFQAFGGSGLHGFEFRSLHEFHSEVRLRGIFKYLNLSKPTFLQVLIINPNLGFIGTLQDK